MNRLLQIAYAMTTVMALSATSANADTGATVRPRTELTVSATVVARCDIAWRYPISVNCAKGVDFALSVDAPLATPDPSTDRVLEPDGGDRSRASVMLLYF